MNELPVGWDQARVGDLIDIGPRSECPDDTVVGFVPLHRLGVTFRSRHTFEQRRWAEVRKGYTHFANGDVLLARITPSFENGKAGIARDLPNGLGAGSTEYFVCRPRDNVLAPEYLLAYFKTRPFLRDGEQVMSGAVGQQRVPKQYVLDSEIPLAPRNEQKRIADKLEALHARVDVCRDHLDRVPGILKRLRQSILAAATTGELTRDWREENGVVVAWEESTIAAVAKLVFDGPFGSHLKSKDYVEEGVRVVRLENIAPLHFVEDKRTYVSQEKYESLMKHTLVAGDIVFSSFVADEVRVCLLPDELDGKAINKADCFCIRTDQLRCLPEYLVLRLASRATFQALDDAVHGATRPRINLGQLRGVRFELPTMAEQREIVARASMLLAQADSVERRLVSLDRLVSQMVPSLLTKAFRGDLVPQDPTDESATNLLARLRASAEIEVKHPRKKVSRKPRVREEIKSVAKKLIDVLKEASGWITAQEAFRSCGIVDGSRTEDIEGVYAELRELEHGNGVKVEAVRDSQGRKIHDRLKFIGEN